MLCFERCKWSLLKHFLVGGRAHAWGVFLACEYQKKKIFSKCILAFDQVLQGCSDINYWNWMQLSFHFIVLIDIVVSIVGTCFFNCVSRLRLKFFLFFSYCFLRKRLQLVSKTDLITNGLSLGFFLKKLGRYSLTFGSEWTKNFKKCWNLCLIWRHQDFSITSLRVIPVCCSNVLVLCSPTPL